jgi:hypothetical protein
MKVEIICMMSQWIWIKHNWLNRYVKNTPPVHRRVLKLGKLGVDKKGENCMIARMFLSQKSIRIIMFDYVNDLAL